MIICSDTIQHIRIQHCFCPFPFFPTQGCKSLFHKQPAGSRASGSWWPCQKIRELFPCQPKLIEKTQIFRFLWKGNKFYTAFSEKLFEEGKHFMECTSGVCHIRAIPQEGQECREEENFLRGPRLSWGNRQEDVTKSLQTCWLWLTYCSGNWKRPEEGRRASLLRSYLCE